MPHYLGLDCGGSTTRALVIDDRGREVFRGKSGPANIASTPVSSIQKHLSEALYGCPEVDAAVGCFAGILTAENQSFATGLIRNVLPACQAIRAWPDYAAALEAAGHVDALVISGTGFKVCWWGSGEIQSAGGGGPLLGDVGSAFSLGGALLRDALLFAQPMTDRMKTRCVERLGSIDVKEIIAAIYRDPSPASLIASFAEIDAADAQEGHLPSVQRMKQHLKQIASEIRRSLQWRLEADSLVRVAATGGFWKMAPTALASVESILNQPDTNHPLQFKLELLTVEPVLGAARLARNLITL